MQAFLARIAGEHIGGLVGRVRLATAVSPVKCSRTSSEKEATAEGLKLFFLLVQHLDFEAGAKTVAHQTMLSLGAVKDGVILPSEEDRKRIITQMKVRTTLKGDKSWIQQRSDGEEEQHCSPLRSPVRTRGANGRSPVSPRKLSPIRSKPPPTTHEMPAHPLVFIAHDAQGGTNYSHQLPSWFYPHDSPVRTTSVESPSQAESQPTSPKSPSKKSPSATQSSGYLIRGVFTKTIDKTGPSNTAANGSPKSAKTASMPRTSPGYKMSTEEYKKLAPYNVKREPTDPHDSERTVSSDEQKKRTEAASSVLRRTAGKERSYVFSAAKKSSGRPSEDTPSFLAKRVDIEDDIGPRSRSQTVPASGWFSGRGKNSSNGEKRSTSESPWSEPRMANAASTTSIDTSSRSQAPKPSSESSTFNHYSSLESSYKRPGDQEKSEPQSRSDHVPKTPTSPLKTSENGGKLSPAPGTEKRSVIFSEDSYRAKPKGGTESQVSQAPHITISPEASPKRPSGSYRTSDAETGVDTHHQPKVGEYMSDRSTDVPRSALDQEGNSFRDVKYGSSNSQISEYSEHRPVNARDSMNAISGESYKVPVHPGDDEDVGPNRSFSGFERKSMQELGYESPSDTEYKKVEARLAKSGSWSSESSLSTTGTQSKFLRTARRDEPELDTARSSSLSTESGTATPESQQGEYGYDSDTARRVTSGIPETNHRTSSYLETCHRTSSYLDRPVYSSCVLESERKTSSSLNRQSPNTFRSGTSHGVPSFLSSHSYGTSTLEMSHGRTLYLSNQTFNSGSRSYYPFRDNYTATSSRSHRVPFYKDSCEPEVGSKGLLFVKESVNTTELSSSPRFNSRSMVDLSDLERSTYSSATSLNSVPPKRSFEEICTYCGREIRNCAKITIENLKICCHEYCFRCGICHKPMGDLLDKIFIHRDIVHCDKCYEKLF